MKQQIIILKYQKSFKMESIVRIIEGKFCRSEIQFKKTFLNTNYPVKFNDSFNKDEKLIIYYVESADYSWYLTNKRIIVEENIKKLNIFFNDVVRVDFINIKNQLSAKTNNRELDLITKDESFVIKFEENSWHVFYNIIKFLINNKTKI